MNVKNKLLKGSQVLIASSPTLLERGWKIPVATAIAETLAVGIEYFSEMSAKKSNDLFESIEFTDKVISEIQKSDDYASFVLDLWRRFNLESSEARRIRLKNILHNATNETQRNYENFSKLFLVSEQITSTEIIVLEAFYSTGAYTYAENPNDAKSYQINVNNLNRLFGDKAIKIDDVADIGPSLTQLANYGLMSEQPAPIGGPFYSPLKFGHIFLEYIES